MALHSTTPVERILQKVLKVLAVYCLFSVIISPLITILDTGFIRRASNDLHKAEMKTGGWFLTSASSSR